MNHPTGDLYIECKKMPRKDWTQIIRVLVDRSQLFFACWKLENSGRQLDQVLVIFIGC